MSNYAKKTKAILVMDCEYLSSERDRVAKERNDLVREREKDQRSYDLLRRKNVALQVALEKLIQALDTLRKEVGI